MRILVIEDEEDLADAIADGLRRAGYAADIALDGSIALEAAEVNHYDVLILDIGLPVVDGLEVCRQVRRMQPEVLTLMLTARSRVEERIRGLDSGADDYLVKPFAFDELLARLRALLRRDLRMRAPLLSAGNLVLDPAARLARVGSRTLDLTRKEYGVLDYLLRHQGEVVSQEDLLEHVWDDRVNLFTNTVRVHLLNVRRKLTAAGSEVCVETAIGQGYRLVVRVVPSHE